MDSLVVDARRTDLRAFHTHMVFDELDPRLGGFTMIRKISQGINGDIFEYCWQPPGSDIEGERVAVKRLTNSFLDRDGTVTDEWDIHKGGSQLKVASAEDPLTEIGVLSYLAEQPDLSDNLLRLRKVFADASEPFTWIVTELAEEGDLFEMAAASNRVTEADARRYAQQLLRAISYLHDHYIGHRDVSLENILLKDGCVKLMDFGSAVRSHSPDCGVELRYFRTVGKDYYRAPECYVPMSDCITVVAPAAAAPGQVVMIEKGGHFFEVKLSIDATPGKSSRAVVWGYAAMPADLFASGICIFALLFKFSPWERARGMDYWFAFAHEKGLEQLLRRNRQSIPSSETMQLLTSLLQTEPSKRPSASTALTFPWFNAANV
jgi:serine/threonine protein kinase